MFDVHEWGPAGSRCLGVLVVAVNQASDMTQWYTATKELQVASLELCAACRGAHTVHLRVDATTPAHLVSPVDAPRANSEDLFSRVPRPRARRVTWKLPSLDVLSNSVDTFAQVEEVSFCNAFNGSLEVRTWPTRLIKMEFDVMSRFNQPVGEVAWPGSLRHLVFGSTFNQPIDGVTWPTSLQQLIFGYFFNQPIDGVMWPPSLQQLTFGYSFNQPVEGVKWPSSLQTLKLDTAFNQPIDGVSWPPSLEEVAFGMNFDQPIDGVKWPLSMRRLVLMGSFSKSLSKLGIAMPFLERFTLMFWFAATQYAILRDIEWPSGLKHLTIGEIAHYEEVVIPSSVSVSYT